MGQVGEAVDDIPRCILILQIPKVVLDLSKLVDEIILYILVVRLPVFGGLNSVLGG